MEPDSEEPHVNQVQVILLIFLAVSMVSSASILIRISESHPLAIVFWRTMYGSIVMAMIGLFKGDFPAYRSENVQQNRVWFVLIGVALSLHFSTWFISLTLTSVAASVVLVDSAPIFTAIFSTLVLKEPLSKRSWAGIVIAITGAVVLTWGDFGVSGPMALIGDLLALSGAFFLALYFIGGRRFAKGIPNPVYTSIVYFVAAIVTLLICISFGVDVLIFEPREVLIFMALAIFPTALGHSVNNYLLTIVPAYVISSAVLGEPIGATILAIIFLNEIPVPTTIIGFIIIVAGIALVLIEVAYRERAKITYAEINP
jgi:drug/metabolite transporter (DMT)-like permease